MKTSGRAVLALLSWTLALSFILFVTAAPGSAQTTTTTNTTISAPPGTNTNINVNTTTTAGLAPLTFDRVCFPGTVQSIGPEGVTLNVYGNTLLVPRGYARFQRGGAMVADTSLNTGDTVMVVYPRLSGTFNSINGNQILVSTPSGGNIIVPVASLPASTSRSMVYVRLADGSYARVPLSTALNVQTYQGGTIVSSLPSDARLLTDAQFRAMSHCAIYPVDSNLRATGDIDVETRENRMWDRIPDIRGEEQQYRPIPFDSTMPEQSKSGDSRF